MANYFFSVADALKTLEVAECVPSMPKYMRMWMCGTESPGLLVEFPSGYRVAVQKA